MNKHRVFIALLIAMLLLVSLGIDANATKAYGNSIITVNCPFITVSATSDSPATYTHVGRNYILGHLENFTTGRITLILGYPTSTEIVVTATGSTYIRYHYERTWNMSTFLSVGDRFSFREDDKTGFVGKIEGTCAGSTITSNSTPPSGYRLMTIMCSANILSSPGGPVIPPPSDLGGWFDPMPQIGKQRYVLLVGAIGPDGQQYDKIQADAVAFGYFPRRCLGA